MIPYVSIVIPCVNEQRRLPIALDKIQRWQADRGYTIQVLVALNGCTDDSAAMCRMASSAYPWLDWFELPERGKGAALRAGMTRAAGEWAFMADVDLSTPIHLLDEYLMLARCLDADIVIGERQRVGDTPMRKLSSTIFGGMARLLLPAIRDTQCGFKLFRSQAANVLFGLARLDGMAIDIEVLYLAARLGYRVEQLPVAWQHDPDSRVRLVRDSARMALDLLRIWRLHSGERTDRPPLPAPAVPR